MKVLESNINIFRERMDWEIQSTKWELYEKLKRTAYEISDTKSEYDSMVKEAIDRLGI